MQALPGGDRTVLRRGVATTKGKNGVMHKALKFLGLAALLSLPSGARGPRDPPIRKLGAL